MSFHHENLLEFKEKSQDKFREILREAFLENFQMQKGDFREIYPIESKILGKKTL